MKKQLLILGGSFFAGMLAAFFVPYVLNLLNIDSIGLLGEYKEVFFTFLSNALLNVILIVFLLSLGRLLIHMLINRLFRFGMSVKNGFEQRLVTLNHIFISIGDFVLYGTVFLLFLDVFSIDIRPILASLGIFGLVIGFGAQSFIRDCISGIFILLENQYGVGDRIRIDSFEGIVMAITLRLTMLKNDGGEIFYVRNGEITKVANLSRDQKPKNI